jgi:hypothetical protein
VICLSTLLFLCTLEQQIAEKVKENTSLDIQAISDIWAKKSSNFPTGYSAKWLQTEHYTTNTSDIVNKTKTVQVPIASDKLIKEEHFVNSYVMYVKANKIKLVKQGFLFALLDRKKYDDNTMLIIDGNLSTLIKQCEGDKWKTVILSNSKVAPILELSISRALATSLFGNQMIQANGFDLKHFEVIKEIEGNVKDIFLRSKSGDGKFSETLTISNDSNANIKNYSFYIDNNMVISYSASYDVDSTKSLFPKKWSTKFYTYGKLTHSHDYSLTSCELLTEFSDALFTTTYEPGTVIKDFTNGSPSFSVVNTGGQNVRLSNSDMKLQHDDLMKRANDSGMFVYLFCLFIFCLILCCIVWFFHLRAKPQP